MYNCKLCNYSATNNSNYTKHCNTTIHINKEKEINYCLLCNKKYSSCESFKTHKYNIHNKKFSNKINNKKNDVINNTDIDISTKSSKIKNNNKINNNKINNNEIKIKLDKLNTNINNINDKIDDKINDVKEEIHNSKKEVVTVVNKAINKASSLIKYLMENHRSVPPLKKITRNQCISTLRLDYNCPEKNNDYTLQQIFIRDHHRNLFIPNIAKSILKMINYNNKETQPIYNTDSTRYNYVVKVTTDIWNEDKSGIKFTDYIIRPLLRYVRDLVEEYIEEDLDKINMYKNTQYENELLLDEKEKAYTFDIALTNDYLIKPLLKELSPYLRFLQSELEEIEKLEELEKIQEDLQEIIDNNYSDCNVDYNSDTDSVNDNYIKKIRIRMI